MAIFELIGLNEATPQLVAPTASDVGAITGSLVVGSNSITPSGALHVEGNATLNGILSVTGSITGNGITSTGDVSLSGNDLILGGGLVQFDVNTKIAPSGANLDFDVVGGIFLFKIGTFAKLSVSSTKTNIHGNILDLNNGHIQFNNNLTKIIQFGNDLQFDIDTGNSYVFNIFNGPELTISQTFINLHNKNIINVLDVKASSYSVGGTPGASFSGAVSNITVVNGIVTAAS